MSRPAKLQSAKPGHQDPVRGCAGGHVLQVPDGGVQPFLELPGRVDFHFKHFGGAVHVAGPSCEWMTRTVPPGITETGTDGSPVSRSFPLAGYSASASEWLMRNVNLSVELLRVITSSPSGSLGAASSPAVRKDGAGGPVAEVCRLPGAEWQEFVDFEAKDVPESAG